MPDCSDEDDCVERKTNYLGKKNGLKYERRSSIADHDMQKLEDEELESFAGGTIVEVPDSWGKTAYVFVDEKQCGQVQHVYYNLEIAQKAARACGRSDEVITREEYETKFRRKLQC